MKHARKHTLVWKTGQGGRGVPPRNPFSCRIASGWEQPSRARLHQSECELPLGGGAREERHLWYSAASPLKTAGPLSGSLLWARLPAPWAQCQCFPHRVLCACCYHRWLFRCSVMSDSLGPHGLQHARLPCRSLSPRVRSNSRPLSRWCHPTISSSVASFSF